VREEKWRGRENNKKATIGLPPQKRPPACPITPESELGHAGKRLSRVSSESQLAVANENRSQRNGSVECPTLLAPKTRIRRLNEGGLNSMSDASEYVITPARKRNQAPHHVRCLGGSDCGAGENQGKAERIPSHRQASSHRAQLTPGEIAGPGGGKSVAVSAADRVDLGRGREGRKTKTRCRSDLSSGHLGRSPSSTTNAKVSLTPSKKGKHNRPRN